MRKAGIAAFVLSMALCGAAFGAPEAPKPKPARTWLRSWFEHLKQGLSESSVQGDYQRSRVTAVAAVRGDQQKNADPAKPSWKASAKFKKGVLVKAERAEFGKAVDLILEGKSEDGITALDAFEKSHPKSALLPDVREARENARQMASAAPDAEGSKPGEPVKPR